MWVYNIVATNRQNAKSGTDAEVVKEHLLLNKTGPFNILAVGPSPSDSTLDGRPLPAKLLYVNIPDDMPDLTPTAESR